ncbi:MAG: DUF4468 domain-containing protein [Bacteroidales bacterium]|nr:DUF4468 domain-containing protein [Bacteroidales bacterium]
MTMKLKQLYLLILITFILPLIPKAQQSSKFPIDETTGQITYQEVVEEEGTKDDFFNRAIGWINEFYANPVDVTKTRDAKSGIIKGLHRFNIKNTDKDGNSIDAGKIQYQFTLEFKDGRYRYTLYDFILRDASKFPVERWLDKDDPQYNEYSQSNLDQIYEFVQEWIKSLKEGMKPKPEKKDDNW